MKMKLFFITLTVILVSNNCSIAQSNDTLSYSLVSHIDKTTNFQIGFGLLDADYQLGLGVTGYLNISNLFEKISLDASYTYAYLGSNGTKPTEIIPANINNFVNSSFNIGLGYTFMQKTTMEKKEFLLNQNHSTAVEQKVIRSYGVRVGIHKKDFGIKYGNTSNSLSIDKSYLDTNYNQTVYYETSYNSAMVHQKIKMFYLGFSIKESYNTTVKIEKFGVKNGGNESELYIDVLIPFQKEILPIIKYEGSGYGGSYLTSNFTAEDEEIILNKFKFLPLGLRAGKRFTPAKKLNFTIDIYGGASPMYYLKIYESFNVGIKLNFRFFKFL